MRNRVILVIAVLSILILSIVTYKGIEIGTFNILSIVQLKDKNNTLNNKIIEASNLTSIEYPRKTKDLEETYEKYAVRKQEYEDLVGIGSDDEKEIYETKQYDIGYLWKIFGKYATTRNIGIGMDVQKVSNQMYKLNFSVTGEYVNISQFITDIENNSDLYFRIYNFKMTGSGQEVQATFSVQEINIDPSTLNNDSKL